MFSQNTDKVNQDNNHNVMSDVISELRSNFYTAEEFGAVGDGKTDDYTAFQRMLDQVPAGATIILDGTKTYYNAFTTSGLSGSWKITKPVTMYCNGATLTRRKTQSSADNQSAIFILERVDGVRIFDVSIDGGNPIGQPVNSTGTIVSTKKTALCQAIDYGVYVVSSSNVVITGVIERCAFPVWVKSSNTFRFSGSVNYAGQVVPNVTVSDLAYGAGIKLSESYNFDINVDGKGNANATVEVEPASFNGSIVCRSWENISSGMTITDSRSITFKSYAFNSNTGVQIIQTASKDAERHTRSIVGEAVNEGGTWGASISQRSGAAQKLTGVTLRVQSYQCKTHGLYLLNQSSIEMRNIVIDYNGVDTASESYLSSGNDVIITGDVRVDLKMKTTGCYNGLVINGLQHADFPPRVVGDFREANFVPGYVLGKSSMVDLSGSITRDDYMLTSSATNTKVAKILPGGNLGPYSGVTMETNHLYIPGVPDSMGLNHEMYAGQRPEGAAGQNYLMVRKDN
ncbi:hypothetical protein HF675_20195 [Serratia sp. JUb9]|uniref:hypothetical protein n=1 Tax=Serratia sp. JUb9 TaxID=2724469 RepID=UPI00164DFE5E|nr:hypothetical protein [Serratia sp. JUb9]QNK31877.1 hypothetical protein HF675_20195 [Serratia sp. JUb9]QPT14193.1 hypothetical protein I6G37_04130 [Serratia rubidaea]